MLFRSAPSFFVKKSLKRLDAIVPPAMIIETIPAYETGTPNSTCMIGHAEPSNESGRPKLMKLRYIMASKSPITANLVFKLDKN